MPPAGCANPCTSEGEAILCDWEGFGARCGATARHRRELPARALPHNRQRQEGQVWLMTTAGPRHPVSSALVELVCEHHVKDWPYGAGTFHADDVVEQTGFPEGASLPSGGRAAADFPSSDADAPPILTPSARPRSDPDQRVGGHQLGLFGVR
jgi:hypothetical protein